MGSSKKQKIIWLCCLWLLSGSGLAESTAVQWREWNPDAFALADSQDRLILVDVGIEGCTACRRMEEQTYTHPRVRDLLAQHFVAIKVDAEARPDLGERYSDWAWPATIFMRPDGVQVLAVAGNKVPRNFLPILEGLLEQHQAGTLSADAASPYAAPERPISTDLTRLRDQVRRRLDTTFNDAEGGWGRFSHSTAMGGQLVSLFTRAHLGDAQSLTRALKTADGFIRIMDPVWGGLFVAGINNWQAYVPEKRLENQYSALLAFADAYQHTQDPRYLQAARDIDRYIADWMMAEDGTFYTSQEDDAPQLPPGVGSRDYYRLDDKQRREYGVPPIDHAVYTDRNAFAIIGYVRMFEASNDPHFLARATLAANSILAKHQHPEGWLRQTIASPKTQDDLRMRPLVTDERAYLQAQAPFGLALTALYRASGDGRWLQQAQRVAVAMRDKLEDPDLGGYFTAEGDGTEGIVPLRKPLEENAAAAQFLYELAIYTKKWNTKICLNAP